MGERDITAPLLLQKVPSINVFYTKIKEINDKAHPKDIFKFIEEHEYICDESLQCFEKKWKMNMFLITAPLYLKKFTDFEIKQKLLFLDYFEVNSKRTLEEMKIPEIKNAVNKEIQYRMEITEHLLKSITLTKNPINGSVYIF